MISLWNLITKLLGLNQVNVTVKPRLRLRDVFFVLSCLYLLIERISVNPSNFSVQRSAVYEIDHKSLFDFINHAATVERWFQWVSHYKSVDRRPPGIGKQYRAYFYIPYLGYENLRFTVTEYSANSHIVLVSSHVLKPVVEASVTPLDPSHTLFSFNVTFNEKSLLYQLTLGWYLRHLASKHIEDALTLLKFVEQH